MDAHVRNTLCTRIHGQATSKQPFYLPGIINASSSTPPTHACAHALAAAGTPGPQHGTPPENGHGHADTTTQQP